MSEPSVVAAAAGEGTGTAAAKPRTHGTGTAEAAMPVSPRLATVNQVNWANVLDFSQVFRGYRLAINPAKLLLALLALIAIYVGGRALDVVWGPQVFVDEMQRYASERPEVYAALRAARVRNRTEQLDRLLAGAPDLTAEQRARLKDDPSGAYGALKTYYRKQFEAAVEAAKMHRDDAQRQLATGSQASREPWGMIKTPAEMEQDDRARAAARLWDSMRSLQEVVGQGIFQTFLTYETGQFDRLVENTLTLVRVTPVRTASRRDFGGGLGDVAEGQALSVGLLSRDAERFWRSDTVVGCIANMTITGPRWLFTATGPMQWQPAGGTDSWGGWLKMAGYRGAYLLSLGVWGISSLVVMALTGACIARLSALELAGIERAPLNDVFAFSLRRLWVFVTTPLTPFVILLVFGLVMAVVALVGAIPWVGPIVMGLVFVAFLGVSFVLMLLLLGILGGFNLLYPTIAVEGADAFDAMSRAFAYAYARPWRLAWYTLVSLVYGVITFLFVSFVVYLILLLTHTFVGWGMDVFGVHHAALSGGGALETLWPAPQFLRLVGPVNWYAMNWPEFGGAVLVHFWLYVLLTGIGAYVVSYYFSSQTIIYLLLRRSVDGQGIGEVNLE